MSYLHHSPGLAGHPPLPALPALPPLQYASFVLHPPDWQPKSADADPPDKRPETDESQVQLHRDSELTD